MNRFDFSSSAGRMMLAVVVALALFAGLGSVPLFDEDEGAYSQVTREMLDSGDLLTPRLWGQPFFHKPPMIYWTQALSVSVFGVNEFAFRLPSAVASLLWALSLWWFVARFLNPSVAGASVFFLVTALQTNLVCKAAIADALLNFFISATMFAIFAHSRIPRLRYLLAAYVGMALGFLTKGPIAVVIPAAASFLFYLWERRLRDWLKGVCHPLGWALFLGIALPWYVAIYAAYGKEFVKEIFLVHNVGRFRGAMEGHGGPIVYYIPVILLGLMPFTTVLVKAAGDVRTYLKTDLGRFLTAWFLFVLVFFSLAATKLHHYVIYGYVPLLVFMAQSLDRVKRPFFLVIPAVLFLLLLLVLPPLVPHILPYIRDEFARQVIPGAMGSFDTLYYVSVLGALAVVAAVGLVPRQTMALRAFVMGVVFLLLANGVLIPRVAEVMQMPVKRAALKARRAGWSVVMWNMNYPSFNVYYGKPTLRREPRAGDVVITKADKLTELPAHEVVFRQHGIVMAKILKNGA